MISPLIDRAPSSSMRARPKSVIFGIHVVSGGRPDCGSCSVVGAVPVAAALVMSGFPEGAALVFLLVGPATNIATIGAVYRLFGMRVLVIYLLTVIVGSVSFAMIFDAFWGLETTALVLAHQHHSLGASACAVLLTGLLGWFGIRDLGQMLRIQNPDRA